MFLGTSASIALILASNALAQILTKSVCSTILVTISELPTVPTTVVTVTVTAPTSTFAVYTSSDVPTPAGLTAIQDYLLGVSGITQAAKRAVAPKQTSSTTLVKKTSSSAVAPNPTAQAMSFVNGKVNLAGHPQYPQTVTCKENYIFYNTSTKYTVAKPTTIFIGYTESSTTVTSTPIATQTVPAADTYDGCAANNIVTDIDSVNYVFAPVLKPFLSNLGPLILDIPSATACCDTCFNTPNCEASVYFAAIETCLLSTAYVYAPSVAGIVFGVAAQPLIPSLFVTISNGPCGQLAFSSLIDGPGVTL
ncbi:uncharacterized protein LY89DRAFT_736306 [Mollisia scopiformis]|uniref:Uncharacterized protein n=1 Tax=Mollisia scopiformis TaxID=149040 RepID=A0A194X242_MOLSC|nr:uncharacterized protein LY89DRAFT_736306 [Mollisia scopiformis]KUJ14261.1 hypothetical protein LY89DRAFT_736306 [Mollisia scopiformis]